MAVHPAFAGDSWEPPPELGVFAGLQHWVADSIEVPEARVGYIRVPVAVHPAFAGDSWVDQVAHQCNLMNPALQDTADFVVALPTLLKVLFV